MSTDRDLSSRPIIRCPWAGQDELYCRYHDLEWGRPVFEDPRILEKICLEGFQSGLSWRTILHKRERFREVFHGFDPEQVARFDAGDVDRLLTDRGIVRHRGKIEASVQNARATLEVLASGTSLSELVWSFQPGRAERPHSFEWSVLRTVSTTPSSHALSEELRRRGFRFVGPTTCYALMQAIGMVNDHIETCAFRAEVERARVAALSRRA